MCPGETLTGNIMPDFRANICLKLFHLSQRATGCAHSPHLSTCHCRTVMTCHFMSTSAARKLIRDFMRIKTEETSEAFNKTADRHIHPPSCQTRCEVEDFCQTWHLCLCILFRLCLHTLPHTHRGTHFFSSLALFPLCSSFIWCRNLLSLQSQRCCRVKIHSAVQSISHYDKETFVQWGSLKLRQTSSSCPPHTHTHCMGVVVLTTCSTWMLS